MKLISLQLCNFRQFYGQTPVIKFASGKKNTTVIYGNNGAGKTTILNAFTWVLYEKFTAAFASPTLLINKRAIAEASIESAVECWVEIQFERDRKLYQIKRKCYATKDKNSVIKYSPAKLFMLVAGDDGRWYPPLEAPEEIIEGILPASLHQYFFFDGERIDRFFRNDSHHDIAEDTKELLGVKVLDRAIEHLKNAKKTLQEELQLLGNAATKQLLKEQLELEQQSDRTEIRLADIVREIQQLERQKRILATQLLDLSGADQLQRLKDKLIKQEKSARTNLIRAKIDLKKILSQSGYLVFTAEITQKFFNLIADLRIRGQLSSGVKKEFIQQLLDRQICLCGKILKPQTEAYQQVSSWLNKVELKVVEESAIRLETQVNKYQDQREEFWQQVDRQQAEIDRQYTEINHLTKELAKINQQLRNYPNRDIQNLHQNVEIIEEKIKNLLLEQGITQQQLTIHRQAIAILIQQINKHKITEGKQILANERIKATQESITRLTEVRSRLETQFRLSLEQKVREIFNFISFTPYIPKLSSNYQLTLVENTSGIEIPVAASTGENQILSLSFIGGIIDRVREWSQRNTLMGPDSSNFPIVMDSPFGSLDQIYRKQVARAIPQLANQLIILATKTQWRGEVETAIIDRLGEEYVLVYYSPKPDCEKDWLELGELNYSLVKHSSNNFEYTEIAIVQPYS
ncbi:MAG: AAA family ATPase [Pleurocapsa sp.]